MINPFLWCLLLSLIVQALTSSFKRIYLKFGTNLGKRVPMNIKSHLSRVQNLSVIDITESLMKIDDELSMQLKIKPEVLETKAESLLLIIGNVTESSNIISHDEIMSMSDESYIIVSTDLFEIPAIVCNGTPLDKHRHNNISFSKTDIHYGAVLSAYVCLERLGFGFLHPLDFYIPHVIQFSPQNCSRFSTKFSSYCLTIETESPYWPERSFHIHTQHPLELTEVLQGHDIPQFGPVGPHCYDMWSSRTHSKQQSTTILNRSNPMSSAKHGASYKDSSHSHRHMNYCERWEDMVPDVDMMFQWAIANRLNKIEWLLLGNYKWGEGQQLESRKKRMKVLTNLAHSYSLMVGADCPIGNIQQHAWSMVDIHLPLEKQLNQIRDRIDWVFEADFDFITTESGSSEFTHPECELMLNLINEFAEYANGTWGREAGIKVHCSTGQKCMNHLHPETNQPINFNFLPLFASSKLAVFPHTVQVYSLDDPTAGAYGNDNFSYIEDYMVYEAKQAKRSVMFYGETAYWVNVDIDVPLFLPLYGQRRLHDLRRIAGREIKENFRIDGQMNFDSGWEWGYWLNDVLTARASWNPLLSHEMKNYHTNMCIKDNDLNKQCIDAADKCNECNGSNTTVSSDFTYTEQSDQWEAFSQALYPVTSIFGSNIGNKLNKLIIKLTQKQAELLIRGEINGKPSPNIKKLSGMAYMSGNDPWIDLPRMIGLTQLQPNKVNIKDINNPDWSNAILLLKTMNIEFSKLAEEMKSLYDEAQTFTISQSEISRRKQKSKSAKHVHTQHFFNFKKKESTKSQQSIGDDVSHTPFILNDHALALLSEFQNCFDMLSLRAKQVHALYLSFDIHASPSSTEKAKMQKISRQYINQAASIVSQRESNYRTPWERTAAWRENPTVYRYGYLWSVHSLYYWWRDQGLAEQGSLQSELSPCYLNRIDVSETAFGWGKYFYELIRNFINNYSPFTRGYPLELINCLAPPPKEYIFPKDLYPYE